MIRRFATVIAACVVAAAASGASASVIVSLETPSPTTFTDNTGSVFTLTGFQPAGSGVFLPFMRISRTGDAQGYNSSLNNGPNATMDLINLPGNSTSEILLNNAVTQDNKIFLTLDYNEPGAAGKSLLQLTDLVLVVSSDADKTGPAGPAKKDPWTPSGIPLSAGDQVIYQMSNTTDGSGNPYIIQMDADKNAANGNGGSGAADLNVAINVANVPNLATLLAGGKHLYVYSRFADANGGFEEWNIFDSVNNPGGGGGGPGIPEPATLGILTLGGMTLLARRRRV